MPVTPSLPYCEILYSLQLVVGMLIQNIHQLKSYRENSIKFLAKACPTLCQNGQRGDVVIFILNQLRELMEKDENVLTIREIDEILQGVNTLHMALESVLYSEMVTAHWSFILAVCKRYVGIMINDMIYDMINDISYIIWSIQIKLLISILSYDILDSKSSAYS